MSMIWLRQQEELFQSLQTIFRKEESNRSSRHTKHKRNRRNQIVHRILQTKATAYTLIFIYKETNGELGPFLKLCKLMKESDMSVEKVVNAVDIDIHKLPYMEELYGQVKNEVDNMQHTRQYLSNDIQAMKNKISILDATAFSCEQDCKIKEQQGKTV
jgi:hypothetical protein